MLKWSLVFLFVIAATGCGGSTTGPTVPGAAQLQPANATDSGWGFSAQHFLAGPNAKAPAILMNFVATGYPYKGLPCFTCVKGVQTKDNIGLPGPYNDIPHGKSWMYTVSYTDVSFKGNCKLAVTIASKNKTIDNFSTTAKNNKPTFYYMYWNTRKFPKYTGSATVTASLSCSGAGSQSTSAQIFFE